MSGGLAGPYTLTALADLAASCRRTGRHDEAVEISERVLPLRSRVLGWDHPDTLISAGNLVNAYATAGRPGQALKLSEALRPQQESVFGPHDDSTLAGRHAVALLRVLRGVRPRRESGAGREGRRAGHRGGRPAPGTQAAGAGRGTGRRPPPRGGRPGRAAGMRRCARCRRRCVVASARTRRPVAGQRHVGRQATRWMVARLPTVRVPACGRFRSPSRRAGVGRACRRGYFT
ncbi:tetratricopeptide repeat protein [Kitasatospora sp. NPDC001132]